MKFQVFYSFFIVVVIVVVVVVVVVCVSIAHTKAEEKDYQSFVAQGARKKEAIAAVARLAIDALEEHGFRTDEAALKQLRKDGAKRRKQKAKEEAKVIGFIVVYNSSSSFLFFPSFFDFFLCLST